MTFRSTHWISGRAAEPDTGSYLPSYDPVAASPWSEIARGNAADVDAAVASAKRAFGEWRRTPLSVRAERLWLISELSPSQPRNSPNWNEGHRQGDPRDAWTDDGPAQVVAIRGGPVPSPAGRNHSARQDLDPQLHGPGAVRRGWHDDAFQLAGPVDDLRHRPALAAGNTIVVKPSEHASSVVLRFAELFTESGFPDGTMNVFNGLGDELGDPLVSHPDVANRLHGWAGDRQGGSRGGFSARQTHRPRAWGEVGQHRVPRRHVASAVNGIMAGIFAAAGQAFVAGSRVLVHREALSPLRVA